jgi:hypothetical protein
MISAQDMLPPSASPSLHKSGVLKKKTATNGSSARLDPIENYGRGSMASTIQHNDSHHYDPYTESQYSHGRNPGRQLMQEMPSSSF